MLVKLLEHIYLIVFLPTYYKLFQSIENIEDSLLWQNLFTTRNQKHQSVFLYSIYGIFITDNDRI